MKSIDPFALSFSAHYRAIAKLNVRLPSQLDAGARNDTGRTCIQCSGDCCCRSQDIHDNYDSIDEVFGLQRRWQEIDLQIRVHLNIRGVWRIIADNSPLMYLG